jgi:nucleotide-binding universal stress UspA family protein
MANSKAMRVLIVIDGSAMSEAALHTVLAFPWPEKTRVQGVAALRSDYFGLSSRKLDRALERNVREAAEAARAALARRWKSAQVTIVDKAPAEAIRSAARAFRADVLAFGKRGDGAFRRLFAGLLSGTNCSLLVAGEAPKQARRFLLGYDDSPSARRALALVARLDPPRNARAVLVNAVELIELPPRASRLPAVVRASVRSELVSLNAKIEQDARDRLKPAAIRLKNASWTTHTDVRRGLAVPALRGAARAHACDVLVIGSPARSRLSRALLGSVTQSAPEAVRIPVLIAR